MNKENKTALYRLIRMTKSRPFYTYNCIKTIPTQGAQWLSGRVLDSRPKGSGLEPHRRYCVVVLEQDTFIPA